MGVRDPLPAAHTDLLSAKQGGSGEVLGMERVCPPGASPKMRTVLAVGGAELELRGGGEGESPTLRCTGLRGCFGAGYGPVSPPRGAESQPEWK